ncbi:uncharacterized protein LAESUDRAFT_713202 [Laetiporus sulphureus 93-53]|uniref:Uncharacterized protein n=1 Tax=Laetiporus sulphureus 93-53 TaxID=1314785 RepID=A0A165EVT0_9APHY|nr:uncharacterized protein LAESUDRAFT_713202 [Laetiporus sulphureus 93-53]KZT07868.1 hypothetical protein LAESUDRAFT_713202 [Laetiporus sulphureus 93-53]
MSVQLTEHRFLKIHYELKETWKQTTDYLLCSPDFHGHPRRDCVVLATDDPAKPVFGRLLLLFTYTVDNVKYPLALVEPFDGQGQHGQWWLKRDIDVGFYHLYSNPHIPSEIFSIYSIIRGALIVPDFTKEGEYLIVDVVDADMFLRIKELFSRVEM